MNSLSKVSFLMVIKFPDAELGKLKMFFKKENEWKDRKRNNE